MHPEPASTSFLLWGLRLSLPLDGVGISSGGWSWSNRTGCGYTFEPAWHQGLVVDRSGTQLEMQQIEVVLRVEIIALRVMTNHFTARPAVAACIAA